MISNIQSSFELSILFTHEILLKKPTVSLLFWENGKGVYFHYRIMIQISWTVNNKTQALYLNSESNFQSLPTHHGVCTCQSKRFLL